MNFCRIALYRPTNPGPSLKVNTCLAARFTGSYDIKINIMIYGHK
jgi:hypothetical protein